MANWSFVKTAESARRCATEPRAFSPRPVVGRGLSLSGEDRGALFGIFPARLFFYLAWPIPVSVAMSQTSDKQTFCLSEIVMSQFDLPPSYPMGIAIHSSPAPPARAKLVVDHCWPAAGRLRFDSLSMLRRSLRAET
jgi:hypothetical protein